MPKFLKFRHFSEKVTLFIFMSVVREFDQYGILASPDETEDMFVSIDLGAGAGHAADSQNVFAIARADEGRSVFDSIMEQCKVIASSINVHSLVAFLLLSTQNWNVHRLYENWTAHAPQLLSAIGITPAFLTKDPSLHHPVEGPEEGWECDICSSDNLPNEEMLCLPCGHTYCIGCWKNHVNHELGTGVSKIGCMEVGCTCCLPPNCVKDLCGAEVYENYMRFLMDQQVALADTLTVCPNPPCGKPIDLLAQTLCGTAKCSHCAHEFCTECHEASHAPVTCKEKERWEQLTDPDLMKQRMYGENFKFCPNCKAPVEKNGGCNYMKCTACRHEFCWLCMVAWSQHTQDHFHCGNYRKENDPFLKKVDNVNPQLLEQYNEAFMRLGVRGKALQSKMQEICRDVRSAFVDTSLSIPEQDLLARKLLDEVYWANENLRWAQVRMFLQDFDAVKDKPVEQQVQAAKVRKAPPAEGLFRYRVSELQKCHVEISNGIEEWRTKSVTVRPSEIEERTNKLKLFRQAMLKQCDPFYA